MRTMLTSLCLLLALCFIWQEQFLLGVLLLGLAKCSQMLTHTDVFDTL